MITVDALLERAVLFDLGRHTLKGAVARFALVREKCEGVRGWGIRAVRGEMNPWWLAEDGVWRYKIGSLWPDLESAVKAFNAAFTTSRWDGDEEPLAVGV